MSGVMWVVGIPFTAALAAAIPLMFVSTPWLIRINNWAIVGQIGIVLTSWLLLATLPGELDGGCRDFETAQGQLLSVVAFSSIAVGGVALASAVLGVHERAARPTRILAGLATSALYLAIWIPLLVAALCGLS
jgi:hypothetical protein